MAVIRQDVLPSDEEAYNEALEVRMAVIKGKAWAELSAEEKDLALEYLAFKSALTKPPVQAR